MQILGLLCERLKSLVQAGSLRFENQDDYDVVLVCNNACWTIGEIARRIPDQASSMLEETFETFATILNHGILE